MKCWLQFWLLQFKNIHFLNCIQRRRIRIVKRQKTIMKEVCLKNWCLHYIEIFFGYLRTLEIIPCGINCQVSVQLSVVSNSLWPRGLQHTGLPCPSPTPGACSNSCPSSWWCHPNISSSVFPFSSCFQSFPASRSIPMSQLFASGGQSTGAPASASVLPLIFRVDLL